ncbi:MAG: hypothetical protein MK212_22550, partial [Saprospiraceae bacterium]|nr:hypothetical protein [Saprospiraceae bacterium]
IGIVTVIALLLFSFVLLVHSHQLFKVQSHTLIQTIHESHEGLQMTLTTSSNPTTSFQDVAENERSYWGMFQILKSLAQNKTYTSETIALVGAKQPENRTALYLEDNGNPLVMVGNSQITGRSYLPERGIKPGTISGNSFTGTRLIYGAQQQAYDLPEIHQELQDLLEHFRTQTINPLLEGGAQIKDLAPKHSNSFMEQTQLLYSTNAIHLIEHQLTGNIIVFSETKITVNHLSKLEDVILVAPKIMITDGVEGNFQAIASEHIYVGKNVELAYPSTLVVIEKQPPGLQATTQDVSHFIRMDTKSSISGQVVFIGKETSYHYKPQLYIAPNATVIGEVYCNQNTELNGSVLGSVFTANFVVDQFGSIYQNHIFNGTISIEDLPKDYVGLLFNNSKKGVAKWLY